MLSDEKILITGPGRAHRVRARPLARRRQRGLGHRPLQRPGHAREGRGARRDHPHPRPRRRRLRRPAHRLHLPAAPRRRLQRRRLRPGAAGQRRGHRLRARALPQREGGAGDVDGHRLQAAPGSVARVPRGRPARRRDGAAVGAVLGLEDRRGGRGPLLRPLVRPARHHRPHGRRVQRPERAPGLAPRRHRRRRAGAHPLGPDAVQPHPRRRHLRAARAAARRGERARRRSSTGAATSRSACSSTRRSSASSSASTPRCVVEPRSRARRAGSVGDHTKRTAITGPCRVGWRDGFRRVAEHFYPDRVRQRADGGVVDEPTTSRTRRATRCWPTRRERPGSTTSAPATSARDSTCCSKASTRDADLSPATDAGVVGDLRRRLVNRLEVEAWYADHPEIDDAPGARARSTSTACRAPAPPRSANMMSLDPQFRCLRQWEQMQPCPPPTLDGEATDPRRLQLARENEQLPAELKAMHLYEVDATIEDTRVARHGLPRPAVHAAGVRLPRVVAHGRPDPDASEYHRRVVKLLQSQRPPHLWLFKAPHHNFHLEAIVAAYPDARFVMTHRDPAKSVPSWASLVSTDLPGAAGRARPAPARPRGVEHLRVGVEHAIAARARLGEDRFLDVHHRDLDRRPDGHGARGSTTSSASSSTPTVEQTIARLAGGQPVRRARARTATPPSSSA